MKVNNILFLSRNVKRGGAIYEGEVKDVLDNCFNVDALYLNTSKNKALFFNKLKFAYQVKEFRLLKKYQVLITNKEGVYAGIHKKNVPKTILILHHYNENENQYPVARTILKKKLHAAFKRIDAVVVVADYWKNFIAEFINKDKIHVIRNSFDVGFIKNVTENFDRKLFKARHKIPEDKIIVYAGNALAVKGYKEVIEKLDGNKYFIITSGSKDKISETKQLHLNLNYEEYLQLLATADVTVILSKFLEGWNRIAHESLLCGTPVIGTDVGAFGELLSQAGQVIYKPGDDLNSLISELIADKQRLEKGRHYAMQFDKNYFSENWNKLVRKQLI